MDADLGACAEVFYAAQEELFARSAQPPMPRDTEGMVRFFRYLAFEEGGRAWVATTPDDRIAGFGIAVDRDATWFLSFLYVAPAEQARGVGGRLFERLMPPPGMHASGRDGLRHTCVDAAQPISTGLYASRGLVPRMPIFTLIGRPRPGVLSVLPSGVGAETRADADPGTRPFALPTLSEDALGHELATDLETVDLRVLGWQRRHDHARFLADGRLLVRYRGPDGALLGYGYVHRSGRVGPVAVLEPAFLEPLLGDLLSRLEPAGAWRIYVPGVAAAALVPLLRAGVRIEGSPAIWSADRDGPSWDAYLPASFALP